MSGAGTQIVATEIPMKFRRRGGKAVIILPDGTRGIQRNEATIDSTMVKVIARGYRWQQLLFEGVYNTIDDLAAAEKINPSYVSRIMRLACLAPPIVEDILEGRQPAQLTMKDLMAPFPLEWERQVDYFGCGPKSTEPKAPREIAHPLSARRRPNPPASRSAELDAGGLWCEQDRGGIRQPRESPGDR